MTARSSPRASIRRAGCSTRSRSPSEPTGRYPAAIASHPEGLLLAWQSFEAQTGVICCGDNRVPVFGGLSLHDSSYVRIRELIPAGSKNAVMPQVTTNRDSIVVAPGSQVGHTYGEPAYFHRLGNPGPDALPIIGGIAPMRWSGDAYRAMIRTASTPPSILTITREGTVSTTVRPALPTDAFERSNSPDAWPYVFGTAKRLRLFASGRTADPDEGLVTRLRVHELAPPPATNRTRAVRR